MSRPLKFTLIQKLQGVACTLIVLLCCLIESLGLDASQIRNGGQKLSSHLKERNKYKKETSSHEDFLLNLVITLPGTEVQSWRPSVNWKVQGQRVQGFLQGVQRLTSTA
jgi:hypothetical protein